MPKRVLHVGLPKTGSSAFQYILQRNNELLLRHDVWCPPLHLVRDKLTYRFVYRGELGFDIEPFLARPNVLISEEDILGKYFQFEEGRIFPHLERNMKRFSDLMNWEKFDVWIVLRNYGDWLESCYLQWLKGRKIISFHEYCDKLKASELSWPKLLRRIEGLKFVSRINIFLYEEFKENNGLLFDVAQQEFDLPPLDTDMRVNHNPSISDVGYRMLNCIGDMDQEARIKIRKFVLKELSTKNFRKPVILTDLERKLLNDKYKQDINTIYSSVRESSKLCFARSL